VTWIIINDLDLTTSQIIKLLSSTNLLVRDLDIYETQITNPQVAKAKM
jgi:hypothetical protein